MEFTKEQKERIASIWEDSPKKAIMLMDMLVIGETMSEFVKWRNDPDTQKRIKKVLTNSTFRPLIKKET